KGMAAKLEQHRDQAKLSQLLATIKVDLDLPVKPEGLSQGAIDTESLLTLYRDLEFKGWLLELLDSEPGIVIDEQESVERHYETILEQADLDRWLDKLASAPL